MVTREDIEKCCKWFTEEDIPYYYEVSEKGEYQFYITVGEYAYEISQAEILYRGELIELAEG